MAVRCWHTNRGNSELVFHLADDDNPLMLCTLFVQGFRPAKANANMPGLGRFSILSLGVILSAGLLFGQSRSFEVASIRPSEPITDAMMVSGRVHVGMRIDKARLDIGNFRLIQLIMKAWGVNIYQVDGPDWLTSGQAFDIVANLPANTTKEEVPAMLQKLQGPRHTPRLWP